MRNLLHIGGYTVCLFPHTVVKNAVHGILTLPNGLFLSIVGGGIGLYGDGVNTFEVMVCRSDGEMDGDDVHGHLTIAEIEELIAELTA